MPKTMTFERKTLVFLRDTLRKELQKAEAAVERERNSKRPSSYEIERRESHAAMVRELFGEAMKPSMVQVRNAMTGAMVEEEEGTPWSCSVASESYWSA